MDATGMAKLVALLVLVAVFVGTVLITPRIWHGATTRAAAQPPEDPAVRKTP